jgi:hypothetical protein
MNRFTGSGPMSRNPAAVLTMCRDPGPDRCSRAQIWHGVVDSPADREGLLAENARCATLLHKMPRVSGQAPTRSGSLIGGLSRRQVRAPGGAPSEVTINERRISDAVAPSSKSTLLPFRLQGPRSSLAAAKRGAEGAGLLWRSNITRLNGSTPPPGAVKQISVGERHPPQPPRFRSATPD